MVFWGHKHGSGESNWVQAALNDSSPLLKIRAAADAAALKGKVAVEGKNELLGLPPAEKVMTALTWKLRGRERHIEVSPYDRARQVGAGACADLAARYSLSSKCRWGSGKVRSFSLLGRDWSFNLGLW